MLVDRPSLPRTHDVTNQPPPLANYDLYAADAALRGAVDRFGARGREADLSGIGLLAGRPETIALGFEANVHEPELRTHDRFGNRIDEVVFHPAYHELLKRAMAHGLHASSWRTPGPGAQVARAAAFAIWSQVEAGHGCPISMTHAALPALRHAPELARDWEPAMLSTTYDPDLKALSEKRGVLVGMAMTEKQGGSDVRANTTRAEPLSYLSGEYVLTGHKWFCSAPMSDAFLVLAQAPRGLSCFLLPRVLPDGTRNAFAIQRLKDKLGNRSNASSEVEWNGTIAWLVGEEGRGVQTIVEMVNFTRLDCIIGSAACMRQAFVQAAHHLSHRRAFGKRLVEHALAQNVLADLAIESEAATLTFARVAAACDAAPGDAREAGIKRIGTAIGKYWVCKRAPAMVAECLEALGGNGYVEESIMPRLLRESPLNGIWEGSGSVNALDVLRVLARDPDAVDALMGELALAAGVDARYDRALATLRAELADPADLEWRARRVVERMALAFQASLLLRFTDARVASAFCATRLGDEGGYAYGTLPRGVDATGIIARAWPMAR